MNTIGRMIAPKHTSAQLSDGSWGRAVCLPSRNRWRDAWAVLIGGAEAIKWPTNDELNAAINRQGDYK